MGFEGKMALIGAGPVGLSVAKALKRSRGIEGWFQPAGARNRATGGLFDQTVSRFRRHSRH